MVRSTIALAFLIALTGCPKKKTPPTPAVGTGACIRVAKGSPSDGVTPGTCRDNGNEPDCVADPAKDESATFRTGQTCKGAGYECVSLSKATPGVWMTRSLEGACPPGSIDMK